MNRRTELPQTSHHLMIFDEDWDFIERNFGRGSNRNVGAGPFIKQLVHHHVELMKAKARALRQAQESNP